MLYTKFDDVLVCDVRDNEFDGKVYFSAIIYCNGYLVRVALPNDYRKAFDDFIGCYVSFEADLKNYDGKSKYRYNGSSISLSR